MDLFTQEISQRDGWVKSCQADRDRYLVLRKEGGGFTVQIWDSRSEAYVTTLFINNYERASKCYEQVLYKSGYGNEEQLAIYKDLKRELEDKLAKRISNIKRQAYLEALALYNKRIKEIEARQRTH